MNVGSEEGTQINTPHLWLPPRVLVPWLSNLYRLAPLLKPEINSLCTRVGATGLYANIRFFPANPELLALGRGLGFQNCSQSASTPG